jgi:hypothetical protein
MTITSFLVKYNKTFQPPGTSLNGNEGM